MTQVLFAAATSPLETDLDANFTQLFTVTAPLTASSGSTGVGVTPSTWQGPGKAVEVGFLGNALYGYAAANVFLTSGVSYNGGFKYSQSSVAVGYYAIQNGGHAWYSAASGTIGGTVTPSQFMTLDTSGNFLVGTTTNTVTAGGIALQPSGTSTNASNINIGHPTGAASGSVYSQYIYNGTLIGSITQNGTTGVAYNTTSDYRLKADVAPIASSGAFIDALKPVTYTWKSDGSHGTGFIAHELQAVSPTSVTGSKDAVDADGLPVYQAVEYGSAEVIAMLVAEIQALRRRLHAVDGL